VHTYYRQQGDTGRVVVLIHGVGLDHHMWDQVAGRLVAAGHRALRYDLLGHGRTPPLHRDVELRDFTAQLETLLSDLNIDAAAVVGFSLGALVARAYAVRRPAPLTHLALINSVFARSEQQRDAVQQRYREARARGSSALIEAALQRWFSDAFVQASPGIVEQVRGRLNDNEPRGFLPAYKLFAEAEYEPVEQLRGIDVPTLVITGADDSGSTPAMSAQLARCIPHARLQVLEGAKHMLPVENARWLSEALHAFIAAEV
jgi:pimeloyl-ACP methyl ester carboxylesterase